MTEKNKKRIAYSGVLLTEESRKTLLNYLEIPENWEIIAHHMTINLGPIKDEYKDLLGQSMELVVTHIGYTDNVIAVKVDTQLKTKNKDPHITVAINKLNGAKPVMSNEIVNWQLIYPFELEGIISEVPFV